MQQHLHLLLLVTDTRRRFCCHLLLTAPTADGGMFLPLPIQQKHQEDEPGAADQEEQDEE